MVSCLLAQHAYRPGDLPPEGYLEWHEWACVQWKAGIRQVECGRCGKWKTPQELSGATFTTCTTTYWAGTVVISHRLCTNCRGTTP